MQLYLLPGNTVSNRSWIEEVGKRYANTVAGYGIQYYRHWQTGDPHIFFDEEVERAMTTLSNPLMDHIVFAKSIGVAVTLAATNEETCPAACVFVGTPCELLEKNDLDLADWCYRWDIPTLMIQQTNDPLTSYKTLAEEVPDHDTVHVTEVPGDDHAYTDLTQLDTAIQPFLNRITVQ